MKRLFDLLVALTAILILSPLFLIVVLLVWGKLGLPVLFRQQRPGLNGNQFIIYKFRTMSHNDDENGAMAEDSVRMTQFGASLRKFSLDELPQLFNVLSGTMSMVGPRPHAVQHNTDYDKRINSYMTRHRIKPGITGLAQINGYRGEIDTLDKMKKRVEFDMQYINTWSFWLDIEILLKTIPALLKNEAY